MVPGRPLSQTHDRRGTLTVSVETGAHQHDPKNHHTAAEQWRNAVWSLFGSLHLQVSQGCHILGMRSAKYRNCQTHQAKYHQDRANDYDSLHVFLRPTFALSAEKETRRPFCPRLRAQVNCSIDYSVDDYYCFAVPLVVVCSKSTASESGREEPASFEGAAKTVARITPATANMVKAPI